MTDEDDVLRRDYENARDTYYGLAEVINNLHVVSSQSVRNHKTGEMDSSVTISQVDYMRLKLGAQHIV